MTAGKTGFQVLALQKKTLPTPEENMEAIRAMLKDYDGPAADFLVLPEIFICPYDNHCFPVYAQEAEGKVYQFLSELARGRHSYVIGGSVPEKADGKLYNTCWIFDREGSLIGRHRKIHLFDIDVKGGQYYKESDVLSAGEEITAFDTEYGRMGACICFDIRFPGLRFNNNASP